MKSASVPNPSLVACFDWLPALVGGLLWLVACFEGARLQPCRHGQGGTGLQPLREFGSDARSEVPQRLKPTTRSLLYGTAEAVPLQISLPDRYSLSCATVCTCARTRPSSRDRRSCSVAFCTCSCCFRPSISCRCAFICCCCGACGAPFMCEVDGYFDFARGGDSVPVSSPLSIRFAIGHWPTAFVQFVTG